MRTISVDILDVKSITNAIKELNDYQKWIKHKAGNLVWRLAEMGAVNVSIGYARAAYVGTKDVQVNIRDTDDPNKLILEASGETVLVLEFGSGIRFGYGHPEPSVEGVQMGPGTHPDKHYSFNSQGELVENWQNDLGWWIPGGEHTYGNPPSMTMYFTAKELREDIERIAREVFSE